MNQPFKKILMLYPAFPASYWGLQYMLPTVGKKSLMPPLGLITIAAMLPSDYEIRLVDLNCEVLNDEDLQWADLCFLSAMLPQKDALFQLARRCRIEGKPVVMGGPFPTGSPGLCRRYCDVLVRGEAESIWPAFLQDLASGNLKPDYHSDEKPDLTQTPTPRFDLLKVEDYLSIPIQFSRGCPFRCEFCDIIVMFGRRPRTKTPEQIVAELEAVYQTGYRGEIFMVDDNFIGNRKEAQRMLPAVAAFNRAHGRPFVFGTEASVDLAGLDDLMNAMLEADFRWVFLGLETPSEESLKETLKFQNVRGSLVESVDKILATGLHVAGGFIIGFDSDGSDIFDRQIEFIQRTAIPFAHVGLLVALEGTPLYDRMKSEGRLQEERSSYPDTHGHTNIMTRIPKAQLLEGYIRVLETLYSPRMYFERAFNTLLRIRRPGSIREGLREVGRTIGAGLRVFSGTDSRGASLTRQAGNAVAALWRLYFSAPSEYRREALRLVWRVLRRRPDQVGACLDFTVAGYHHHRYTFEQAIPAIQARLEAVEKEAPASLAATG